MIRYPQEANHLYDQQQYQLLAIPLFDGLCRRQYISYHPGVCQIATYQEVVSFWDIDELYAMHEILDIQGDLEAEAMEQAKRRSGSR